MATINPAKVINRAPKIGTLQLGAPGDVAIMELALVIATYRSRRCSSLEWKAGSKIVPSTRADIAHPDKAVVLPATSMVALGHKRTFGPTITVSALPPRADMCGATRDVRYGPKADIPHDVR
jgi:hypothetical protein